MERSIAQNRFLDTPPDEGVMPPDLPVEGLIARLAILVRRVAHGRIPKPQAADIPDVVQEVSLRLWKWNTKYREKGERMAEADWSSFTARTAHNEINRYYSTRMRSKNEVPLNEAASIPAGAPDGNAPVEIISLVNKVWQEICSLSIHQRRSLLLHSSDLVVHLMLCGVDENELGQALEFDGNEWKRILERLPLSDAEIAMISRKGRSSDGRQLTAGAVTKARFDARKRLKGLRK